MQKQTLVVMTLLAVTSAWCLTRVISIEPVKATWSGKAHPVLGVSQIITCNFDSLGHPGYVELFAGEYGQGGDYKLKILTYPGGNDVSVERVAKHAGPYKWVLFDSLDILHPELIVKGKQLEFRFTRAGSDSIECAAMANA